jgi:DNA end-binding protein Ku
MGGGLVAHTLNEQRDLNAAEPLFEHIAHAKSDPEMVQLAVQLIARQTSEYDPADLEDRYETRLRAMLDAKVQGEEVHDEVPVAPASNVVDLMAALRKSLGEPPKAVEAAAPPSKAPREAGPEGGRGAAQAARPQASDRRRQEEGGRGCRTCCRARQPAAPPRLIRSPCLGGNPPRTPSAVACRSCSHLSSAPLWSMRPRRAIGSARSSSTAIAC